MEQTETNSFLETEKVGKLMRIISALMTMLPIQLFFR